jgi:hypothetical protein
MLPRRPTIRVRRAECNSISADECDSPNIRCSGCQELHRAGCIYIGPTGRKTMLPSATMQPLQLHCCGLPVRADAGSACRRRRAGTASASSRSLWNQARRLGALAVSRSTVSRRCNIRVASASLTRVVSASYQSLASASFTASTRISVAACWGRRTAIPTVETAISPSLSLSLSLSLSELFLDAAMQPRPAWRSPMRPRRVGPPWLAARDPPHAAAQSMADQWRSCRGSMALVSRINGARVARPMAPLMRLCGCEPRYLVMGAGIDGPRGRLVIDASCNAAMRGRAA